MNRIVVIGGGHAGAEAAAASARLGVATILVTLRRDGIGQMSCNPAIGGLGKGHLVKEVDALGGLMARAIDASGIQFRTLNLSKGPAVRASRAQADRFLYPKTIQKLLESYPNLAVVEGEVVRLLVHGGRVTGVILADGSHIPAEAVVLTTGTFLRGLMHTGARTTEGGRYGDSAASGLSESLAMLGFSLGRLKTGTPPRIRRSTINTAILAVQPGDDPPAPFSMMTDRIVRPQIECWLTETNSSVHDLIRDNRDNSPLFNGQIRSGGPRYCPSIEDKVFRFADKESHTIFLEPEGYNSDVVYPNGISTSLPVEVQYDFVRKIRGLERAEILQPGYAVEYDFVDPRGTRPTLATKDIDGLYFAGQINGTSGYEEAAAQGLIAGANAALALLGRDPLVVERGVGYIGVMIDDLVTKGVDEPYRMFTSRAEYRLLLREDNAPTRLCPLGKSLGLIGPEQAHRFEETELRVAKARTWLANTRIPPKEDINDWLATLGSAPLRDSVTLEVLLRRPEVTLGAILDQYEWDGILALSELGRLEVEVKFSGYLGRQESDIRRLAESERQKIPDDFSYDAIPGLRSEAREKFKRCKPYSIGQALRIPGITPSSVSLVAIYLERYRRERRLA